MINKFIHLTFLSIGFSILTSCNGLQIREIDAPAPRLKEVFSNQMDQLLDVEAESFVQMASKKVKVVNQNKEVQDEYWEYEYVFDGKITVKENCFKIQVQNDLFFEMETYLKTEDEYRNALVVQGLLKNKREAADTPESLPELNSGNPFKYWKFLKKGEIYTVKGKFKMTSSDGAEITSLNELEIMDYEKN